MTNGPLSALDGAPVDTGWTPDGDGAQSFLFTVTVDDELSNEAMGDAVAGVDLIWSVETAS